MKKNTKQLSFLHCYHHSIMAAGTYVVARWFSGGLIIMLGIVNGFVHSVMYSYYVLTLFNQDLKKSIWWKKHITQIQIGQFSFLAIHFLRAILAENCGYPKHISCFIFLQNAFMLAMFLDFYRKTYLKIKKK